MKFGLAAHKAFSDTIWIRTMKHYMYDPNDNSSLSQNFITDIAETGEHTMLVATERYKPL